MTADLSDFITTLYPADCAEEGSIKISKDLEALPFEELLALAGLDSTTEQEKRAYMGVDKVGMYGDDDKSWLEQFAGSPLHQSAIQLCEKDLEMRTQHLQKRMAREKEDHSSEWNESEQLGIEKKRLELALHKQKATEVAPEAAPEVPTGPAPSAKAATPPGKIPTPPLTAAPKTPTAPLAATPQTATSPAAGAGGTKTSAKAERKQGPAGTMAVLGGAGAAAGGAGGTGLLKGLSKAIKRDPGKMKDILKRVPASQRKAVSKTLRRLPGAGAALGLAAGAGAGYHGWKKSASVSMSKKSGVELMKIAISSATGKA